VSPASSRAASDSTASVTAVALGLLVLTTVAPVAAVGDAGTGSGVAGVDPEGAVAQSNDGTENRTLVAEQPRILELFPNPTAAENRGEYLVVRLPERGNWSLSDGYYEAAVPANASGVVALSMDPANTTPLLDDETAVAGSGGTGEPELRVLDGYFPLAASGDRIELRRNGTAVAVVDYDRAPEGHRWRADWGEWRPRGYDPRPVVRTENATVTPFVLPDSPEIPVEPLRAADDRLLLAGYTLGSERVADLLVAAADRGVEVRVLIEGSPVGGFSARSARLLDRIVAAGVEVRVLDGNPERVPLSPREVCRRRRPRDCAHGELEGVRDGRANQPRVGRRHRNIAILDRRRSGRERPRRPLPRGRRGVRRSVVVVVPERHRVPRIGDGERVVPDAIRAAGGDDGGCRTPDDPRQRRRSLGRADRRRRRPRAGRGPTGPGPDNRIVRALRRAAERGVDVHLLLSSAWYDREENRALVDELADEPIEVAVSQPRGRFGKIHAKGLVVDDTAVVGSLNWNEGAATENREVLLAVEDGSVADFYARAYAADWRGGGVHLPIGLLGGLGVALAGAGVIARREVAFV